MADDTDRSVALSYGGRIPWERYVAAGTTPEGEHNLYIDAQAVTVIKRCSALPAGALSAALAAQDADAVAYPASLLQVLDNMTDVRVMQYTLTLVCDFLGADVERRAAAFLRGHAAPALKTLMQMMGTSSSGARISSREANPYVLEHAARAAATLLSVDPSDQAALAGMLAWVHTNLKLFGSSMPAQVKVTEVASESLMILLRNPELRGLFCGAAGPAAGDTGAHRLVAMLAANSPQLAYASLHCLWLLSLSRRFNALLHGAGAPVATLRVLRPDAPLKVLRMGLALLVNLMKDPACGDTVTLVVESGQTGAVLEALAVADPPLTDPELLEDVRWLREAVAARGARAGTAAGQDNVQRYEKELGAGAFHWTVLHTAAFWKENARAFERDGGSLLKQLAALLTDASTDDVTLAVALFDAGEFVAAHPQGRLLATSTGLLDAVRLHLEAPRKTMDDVKQQALMAMSKCLQKLAASA